VSDEQPAVTLARVEATLRRLWLADAGLRREDQKKARELTGLLAELARIGRRRLVVDAAAGHAYAGLVAAELLGVERLVVIEREPERGARCRLAAQALTQPLALDVRVGPVGDAALWPGEPDVVIALHACGPASDDVLDRATAARARWILLAPCCYGRTVPFAARAEASAEALGVARHPEVRRRVLESLIDVERTLRLEAAGYQVTVAPFVPPTVSGHPLLWRARRVGEPRRMAEARDRLAALYAR
jgi:hypothetical protein